MVDTENRTSVQRVDRINSLLWERASEKCSDWWSRNGGEDLVVRRENEIRERYGPVSAIDQNVSDQRAGGNRELRFERNLHCHQPVIMSGRCHGNCYFGVFLRNEKSRSDIF